MWRRRSESSQFTVSSLSTNLCCHDDTRSAGIDGDVPRHQTHILKLFVHLSILLVAKRLLIKTRNNNTLILADININYV